MTAIDARTGACQAMRRIGDDAAADVAEADREERRVAAPPPENWATFGDGQRGILVGYRYKVPGYMNSTCAAVHVQLCQPSGPHTPAATMAQCMWDPSQVVIISGLGGDRLAEEIAGIIGLPSSCSVQTRTTDGESRVQLGRNVRGRVVFVVQSTPDPVNDNLIELALILSACRRASARRVCAVVPYLAYSRQTRKQKSRVPISAADVASLLEESCVDALLTVDIHDAQIAGFYSPRCAFTNTSYIPIFARHLTTTLGVSAPVVVSPHASGVPFAMKLVEVLRQIQEEAALAHGANGGRADGASAAETAARPSDEPPSGLLAPALAMLNAVERRGIKELELTGDVRDPAASQPHARGACPEAASRCPPQPALSATSCRMAHPEPCACDATTTREPVLRKHRSSVC